MDEGWPSVPDADLTADGWERVDRSADAVFQLPTAEVTARTVVYEDANLRERLDDDVTRFAFATALSFQPPLMPGVGPMIESTVTRQAKRRFADDLRERGFEDLTSRDQGEIRVGGTKASLSNVRATYELSTASFDVTGWLAVWRDDRFRLAGGAYPAAGPGIEGGAAKHYRAELLDLVRAVN
jgi:hypothetical protein